MNVKRYWMLLGEDEFVHGHDDFIRYSRILDYIKLCKYFVYNNIYIVYFTMCQYESKTNKRDTLMWIGLYGYSEHRITTFFRMDN